MNAAKRLETLKKNAKARTRSKQATVDAARESGAVDEQAFENAIRENLSPEGVAALVMALQPAGSIRATTPEGEQAMRQVEWFRDTLLEMIGVETFNRTMDELGF